MFTTRLFHTFLAIALLILIAIGSLGLVALPNTEARGTFVTTSTTVHSTMQDKFNTVIDLSSTITYTGTLEGISTLDGTLTIHPDGSGTLLGVETFTGSVNGTPGTLTFKFEGANNLYQAIQLTNTIVGGTGQLASLDGALAKVGMIKDNGPVGTYTGQLTSQ